MSDIRSILHDSVSHDLLRNNSLSVTDELALVRQVSKLLEKREGDLKQIVLADRENRVGAAYYASVSDRAGSVSWAKVADELAKKLYLADDDWHDSDLDALKARHTGKPSIVVGVDALPDLELVLEALDNGFVCLDFETTGLSTARDVPVSVGLVNASGCDPFIFKETFYSVVNPGRPIPAAATEIHGITDVQAAFGITLEEMSRNVVEIMDSSETKILIGQNLLSFDLPILRRFLPKGADSGWRYLDTRVLSKVLWPGESASADAISERLGVAPRTGHHDALGDAKMTARHFTSIARNLLIAGL